MMDFEYRIHVVERMFQRNISEKDVEKAVLHGEIIEEYPDDEPYPSYLTLHFDQEGALHVVYALGDQKYIISTAYRPDPDKWVSDFRQRRKT